MCALPSENNVLVDEWPQHNFQTYIICQLATRKPILFEDEQVPKSSQTRGLENGLVKTKREKAYASNVGRPDSSPFSADSAPACSCFLSKHFISEV
jgi:hypothetical protein